MVLVISIPSMIIAYLKLRKRNLGPILDANGWAVNARAKINVPFGGVLTQVATLPAGCAARPGRSLCGKEAALETLSHAGGNSCPGVVLVLGKLDSMLPGKLKSTSVLKENAPAYVPPPSVTVTNVPGTEQK